MFREVTFAGTLIPWKFGFSDGLESGFGAGMLTHWGVAIVAVGIFRSALIDQSQVVS
jgi:hypothetical protein